MNRTRVAAAVVALVSAATLTGCSHPQPAVDTAPGLGPLPTLVGEPTTEPTVDSSAGGSSPSTTDPAAPSRQPAATPTDDAGAQDGEVDTEDLSWRKAALGFATAYARTSGGYQAWVDGLRPWVSDYVLSEFSTPGMFEAIPKYAPADADVVLYGDQEMRVTVRYDSSWFAQQLTLTRQDDPEHPWLVAAVTRPPA